MPAPALTDIERVFREEYGRAVAVLARVFGDIDIAEDAVQDAFAEAARRWPSAGLPPSPAGWIVTTARNRGIDRLRREAARDCLRRDQPGPYQIQAAINAVHSDAPVAASTDWNQILRLYDQLLAVAPSPVVALNRAVAVAEVDGPAAALALVDGLDLGGYYLFHAIRADLLRRLGRRAEAAAAYELAIARNGNAIERAHLTVAKEQASRTAVTGACRR